MKIRGLLANLVDYKETSQIEITGVTSDSRKVKPGYLFVALSKTASTFIPQAIKNGAVAIIGNTIVNDPIFIKHSSPREVYSKIAKNFYKNQPKKIVAVTGTNGKTSVVNFCQQLWYSANLSSASIGTVGLVSDLQKKYQISLTTPDAAEMHCILNDLQESGVNYAAIEASSHGLDQRRVDSVDIIAAGFTNLSQDHYDYHNNHESYFSSKQRLFSEILPEQGTAVLNSDISEYAKLLNLKQKIISYGNNSLDIKLIKNVALGSGQVISFSIYGSPQEIFVPIMGKFQVYNILCAVGLVLASGIEDFDLSLLRSVWGRMQLVENHGYRVVIDYAHTHDALRSALISLRWHMGDGRIILVFGCGGNRDKSKRIIMGKVADIHADVVIVCDDNPRNENPNTIRQEIIAGCKKAIEIPDRKKAIITAINEAKKNDIILVAGKGHEEKQIFDSFTLPFNDFLTINDILC